MRSNNRYRVGLIGSGSWATAIAKIMTDNHFQLHWWLRSGDDVAAFKKLKHNPRYLTSLRFDLRKIRLSEDLHAVIASSDWVIIAIPAAYLEAALGGLPPDLLRDKYVVSGVKGMLPGINLLLNEYLERQAGLRQEQYFCITGPCHAEEVAAEKLSYLTISGREAETVKLIARRFRTPYLHTTVNDDVPGAQYAAAMKNIYAIGAGMARGLGYGDNFASVWVANAAREMALFLDQVCPHPGRDAFGSAYLGDLLVTCYSQYSRNRSFGQMIGQGYSVRSAQLELGMVAEGYHAARCLHELSMATSAPLPMAGILYQVLWEQRPSAEAMRKLTALLQ